MKQDTILNELSEFFYDKRRAEQYLERVAQGAEVRLQEVDTLLKDMERWKSYPSFSRSIEDSKEELLQLQGLIQMQVQRKVQEQKGSTELVLAMVHDPRVQEVNSSESGCYSSSSSSSSLSPSSSSQVVQPINPTLPRSTNSSSKTFLPKNTSFQKKEPTIHSRLKLSTPHAQAERKYIASQEAIFTEALEDLLKNRLEETIAFGKQCSIGTIATYLKSLFGEELFFDSLLSLTQQYALADVSLVNEQGNNIGKTGFHLAYCGDPGTGKTFSIKDLILGNSNLGVMAHGLKGRNRYCGSITPAKFVRIAEAYQDQRFNFIVPEFDDWFRYKGMTNTLKTALEGGLVEYETFRDSIGPYQFSSFFSVNYNVKITGESYDALIKDPHFKALEDRMLLTVHRLTPKRYRAVAKAKEQLEKGLMDWGLAPALQDLTMLTYAIQILHHSVDTYTPKAVMVPASFYEQLQQVRENLMTAVAESGVMGGERRRKNNHQFSDEIDIPFSPRLEKKVLQLAGAFSLPGFFQNEGLVLQMSKEAISYAFLHLAQEAIVRGRLQVSVEELLEGNYNG